MPETRTAAPLILASASRARRDMLHAAGLAFEVVPADVDEDALRAGMSTGKDAPDPSNVARVLAEAKSVHVSKQRRGALVIGADQILALGTRIFTKPANREDARGSLLDLRGQTHALHSAVAVARNGNVQWTLVDVASLTMRGFSDEFLESYLEAAGERVCSSVGAYEIEGLGIGLFEAIAGSHFTILGLPLLPLLTELRRMGALPS